jgi:putative ABC transport system permease protein
MRSAASYALASTLAQPGRTLVGAVAIGLVVAATGLLAALASRLERALAETADPRNLVVLAAGASGEGTSVLARPVVSELRGRAEVALTADGRSLALSELVIEMQLARQGGAAISAVVRGVEPLAAALHERLRLREGRWPRRGEEEAMLGGAVAARLGDVRCGDRLDLGRGAWTVVGLFDAAGATYEDEVWVDQDDLAADAARTGTTSIVRIRTGSDEARDALAADIAAAAQPALEAFPEPVFYRRQAQAGRTLRGLVVLLAALAGAATAAGLANLFHASVDRRRREIGVLRALGFGRTWVIGAVQIEAIAVAGAGFAIGALVSLAASALVDARASAPFGSSVVSSLIGASAPGASASSGGEPRVPVLDVTASDLVPGAVLALAIGLVAAAGPAWRATRFRPAEVLRAG